MSLDQEKINGPVGSYQRCLKALSDEINRTQEKVLRVEKAMTNGGIIGSSANAALAEIQLMDEAVQVLQSLTDFANKMADPMVKADDDAFEKAVAIIKLEKVRDRMRSVYYDEKMTEAEDEAGVCVFL